MTMKHLALMAAAGSLAMFAAPAQAADFGVRPAPATMLFAGLERNAGPITEVAGFDRRWDDRRYSRGRDDRRWDGRRLGRRDRVWRDRDGRYRCNRDDGTVGLVIGAGVGALVGRAVDTRGDRTLGTVLGAVGGGLLGREIDRGELRCR